MRMVNSTVSCLALTLAAASLSIAPVQAQTSEQLARTAQSFLNMQVPRLRRTLTESFILSLQRNPPQAQIVNGVDAVCRDRIVQTVRNNFGCNPADAACAQRVSGNLLRNLLLNQLDTAEFVLNVVRLPRGSTQTSLANQFTFQETALRRAGLNLADGEVFRRFSAPGTQLSPAAGGPPLRVQIDVNCDINDAPPGIAVLRDTGSSDAVVRAQLAVMNGAIQLLQTVNRRPDRATICRTGGRTPAGLDISQTDACEQLTQRFLSF